jgi:hypothetical protein
MEIKLDTPPPPTPIFPKMEVKLEEREMELDGKAKN